MERCFADIHQHLLWGLDDGPETPEQMKAMLRQNVSEGIGLVFATAHASPGARPFDASVYAQRLAQANDICQSEGWPLRVVSGCEIFFSSAVPDMLSAGRVLALGGSRHVLIEFSPLVKIDRIEEAADDLYRAGYVPVIAHVERYRCLVTSPQRAMQLREAYGLLYQMNCETVLRPRGIVQRRFVKRMLAAGAVDAIATDAHDAVSRPVRMRAAYERMAQEYGVEYAGRVCAGLRINAERADLR